MPFVWSKKSLSFWAPPRPQPVAAPRRRSAWSSSGPAYAAVDAASTARRASRLMTSAYRAHAPRAVINGSVDRHELGAILAAEARGEVVAVRALRADFGQDARHGG